MHYACMRVCALAKSKIKINNSRVVRRPSDGNGDNIIVMHSKRVEPTRMLLVITIVIGKYGYGYLLVYIFYMLFFTFQLIKNYALL